MRLPEHAKRFASSVSRSPMPTAIGPWVVGTPPGGDESRSTKKRSPTPSRWSRRSGCVSTKRWCPKTASVPEEVRKRSTSKATFHVVTTSVGEPGGRPRCRSIRMPRLRGVAEAVVPPREPARLAGPTRRASRSTSPAAWHGVPSAARSGGETCVSADEGVGMEDVAVGRRHVHVAAHHRVACRSPNRAAWSRQRWRGTPARTGSASARPQRPCGTYTAGDALTGADRRSPR